MNKRSILRRLEDTTIDSHERESLSQLLHYLQAEGLNSTTTTNNNPNNKHSHKRRTHKQPVKPKR
jgi:hypothetical protein